jgi:hypothetical protein
VPDRARVDPEGEEFEDALSRYGGEAGGGWAYFGAWELLHRAWNHDDGRDSIDLIDDYAEDMDVLPEWRGWDEDD